MRNEEQKFSRGLTELDSKNHCAQCPLTPSGRMTYSVCMSKLQEHIDYEHSMADMVAKVFSNPKKYAYVIDGFMTNVLIESFWVHARNLIYHYDKLEECGDVLQKIEDQITTLGKGRTGIQSEELQTSFIPEFNAKVQSWK